MTRDPMRNVATFSGMRAMADNRFLGRFRLRRWRRRLVVAIAVLWSVTLAGWLSPAGAIPEAVWVGAIVPMIVAAVLLVLATRNLTSSVDAFVDERDRAVRDRVHRIGYWAFGAPFGALLGLTHSMVRRRTEDGVVTFTTGEASAIAAGTVTLVLLYMLLPTVILGWTEPDPPIDEDDEA